ncbi:lysylphosphatidylglycerol synthase transmembrane domain-containing protein [Parasporobacterium paucivorans]|uniref:Phosphatidylglycerol lysyltransferase n=1 Tax=Parasporobacterium paucivorans DSM 15970 TaxID=1122934 RepID=A0A1M6JLF8_9FIRM|nr:lysylphosphatidylglycerol synthase transmembrane domain-containing protein [Parasporobacterium paucivorans]SHJ47528.1 hypothetical protein SAMN02745691_02031 [Parasporobacterium paucivorans DSM 15970]
MKIKLKKILFPLIIICLLVIVLYRMFRGSFGEILSNIRELSILTFIIILICSLLYQVTEGIILTNIIRKHKKDFSLTQGILTIFQGCFYRGITFGGGTQAGQVYFLYKKGLAPSQSMSSLTLSYAIHKVGMFLYISLFFLFNFGFYQSNYGSYLPYIKIGYLINIIIVTALILLAVSRKTHLLIIRIATSLLRKEKHKATLDNITLQIKGLSADAKVIIKDKKLLPLTIVLELVKFSCWYVIPFFILTRDAISLTDSLSLTAFSNALVGIIPLPSGIMSTELAFTVLFSVFVDIAKAGAAMIIYRFTTYIVPFLVGILVWTIPILKKRLLEHLPRRK